MELYLTFILCYAHDDHGDEMRVISELQKPAALLFISQVICEHGAPWWNDIDRGKLLIRPRSALTILPAETLVAHENKLGEGNYEFTSEKYLCSYFEVTFYMP
jgi:hypothetical protein